MRQKHTCLTFCFTALLISCTSTETQNAAPDASDFNTDVIVQQTSVDTPNTPEAVELTLKQIMSDPDWLGRQPESPGFAPMSDSVVYERKREGSVVRDLYVTQTGSGNGQKVDLKELHRYKADEYIDDPKMPFVSWTFEGNVFIRERQSQDIQQLTSDTKTYTDLSYFDGRGVSVRSGNSFYAIDLQSGLNTEILTWQFAEKPT
ncbi:MAG: S9 family peptidase, partial [Pseudomonadota bacterium]